MGDTGFPFGLNAADDEEEESKESLMRKVRDEDAMSTTSDGDAGGEDYIPVKMATYDDEEEPMEEDD